MKNTIKNILLAMVVVPLMVSSAFAAAKITNQVIDNTTTVTTALCPLLTSAVKINLSTGINAAMSCDQAAGDVKIATCSVGGSAKASSIVCQITNSAAILLDPTVAPKFNDATCDAAKVTAATTFTSIGRSYYSMSTGGGAIIEAPISTTADSVCDANAILAKITR